MDPRELQLRQLALEQIADPDASRIQAAAAQNSALDDAKTQVIDPKLLQKMAEMGGYRGTPGVHPAPVGGAPGLQFNMLADTAAQPERPKRNY